MVLHVLYCMALSMSVGSDEDDTADNGNDNDDGFNDDDYDCTPTLHPAGLTGDLPINCQSWLAVPQFSYQELGGR